MNLKIIFLKEFKYGCRTNWIEPEQRKEFQKTTM